MVVVAMAKVVAKGDPASALDRFLGLPTGRLAVRVSHHNQDNPPWGLADPLNTRA